jgi:methyl-accepting chemotaxis protein
VPDYFDMEPGRGGSAAAFKVAVKGFGLMARSRQQGRHSLTIQQIFQLLAFLNGVVLASLLLSAWQLLHDQTSSVQHAATTIFLALLLVVGLVISYRIVALRVIRPLGRLVRQSDNLAFDHSLDRILLDIEGNDEIARLAHAFNGVLLRQREAIQELDAANSRLREVNQQIDDSIRHAALLQNLFFPIVS